MLKDMMGGSNALAGLDVSFCFHRFAHEQVYWVASSIFT